MFCIFIPINENFQNSYIHQLNYLQTLKIRNVTNDLQLFTTFRRCFQYLPNNRILETRLSISRYTYILSIEYWRPLVTIDIVSHATMHIISISMDSTLSPIAIVCDRLPVLFIVIPSLSGYNLHMSEHHTGP